MTAAVDFGSNRIRVLNFQDNEIVSRGFRSVYSVLPDSQEQRTLLRQLNIPFAMCESHLAVLGDHADQVRCMNTLPPVPIISGGRVVIDDPPARQILNVLIESMLPAVTNNETCAIIAAGGNDSDAPEFLKQLVTLRGYQPSVLTPGHATVLSEGTAERFNAIGITFGSQCCDIALVARGNLLDRGVVNKGGEWMDIQLARQNEQFVFDRDGQCYLDTATVTGWKEAEIRSLLKRDSVLEHMLSNLYAEMLNDVVVAIEGIIARNKLSAPISILCTGGVSTIGGFVEAFRSAFRASQLTTAQIGNIRVISDPLAVARGGLIQVALHEETRAAA